MGDAAINGYHEGEVAVQERAGVRAQSEQMLGMFRPGLPMGAARFLAERRFIITGSRDGENRLWAGILTGAPGFLELSGERTLEIHALPHAEDPLREALEPGADLGTLIINPALRQRIRVNGRGSVHGDSVRLDIGEVFGNCPKFIQQRNVREANRPGEPRFRKSAALNEAQAKWIGEADTFFIATAHEQRGADASHRGGMPGFVRIVDENTLLFPDYTGNNMYLTLGNIARDPRAGLLFPDFEHGGTLRVSGRAEILWDDPRASEFAGATKLIQVTIDAVLEGIDELPLRWELEEYSPFNP